MRKNQHVVPRNGLWAIKGEKNDRYTSIHNTQKEAIKVARGIAQNQSSELVIHGRDGQIRDKDSFGNDNCPPKDKKH